MPTRRNRKTKPRTKPKNKTRKFRLWSKIIRLFGG